MSIPEIWIVRPGFRVQHLRDEQYTFCRMWVGMLGRRWNISQGLQRASYRKCERCMAELGKRLEVANDGHRS